MAEQIAMLNDAEAGRVAAANEASFYDLYPSLKKGPNIGAAILSEMTNRGINSAAVGANRAVQEILDQIRTEHEQLGDEIKAIMNAMQEEMANIQEAVAEATGGAAGDGTLDMPEPTEIAPPDIAPMPDVGGELPPEPDMGGEMPPGDMGAPPPEVPGPGVPMAGEMPPPPMEGEVPPEIIGSDKRIKRSIKLKTPPKNVWKPGGHILSAVTRGK